MKKKKQNKITNGLLLKEISKRISSVEFNLSKRIDGLDEKIEVVHKHLTNHVAKHLVDKILQALYFAITIGMFCFLKWGK